MARPDDEWLDRWRDQRRVVGKLTASVENLELDRSNTLASAIADEIRAGKSVSAAEYLGKTAFDYIAICDQLKDERAKLQDALAELADMDRRWETWRTASSNMRSNMQ